MWAGYNGKKTNGSRRMGMTIETLQELVLGSIFSTLYVNDRERCP